jgi:hypothetical protein
MLCHPGGIERQRTDEMWTSLLAGSEFTFLIIQQRKDPRCLSSKKDAGTGEP